MLVFGVMLPFSSAAEAVINLKVEPGAAAAVAWFTSGVPAVSLANAVYSASWALVSARMLGSKSGTETIA